MRQTTDRFAALAVLLCALVPTGCARGGPAPDHDAAAAAHFSSAAATLGEAELRQLMQTQPQTTTLISPLSFEAALAMVAQGARGGTAANLRSGLGFEAQGLTLPAAADGFADLRQSLTASSSVTLNLAEGLWADKRIALKPAFAASQSGPFAAKITTADFADPATLSQINDFVSTATHGHIPTILNRLSPASRLVLINALYFKGAWQDAFEPGSTVDAPFTTAGGQTIQTPTMHRRGSFEYLETAQFQSVALPYKDAKFELVLLLMKDPKAVPAAAWATTQASANYHQSEGFVALPRLDLTWTGDLIDSLSAIGLANALGPHADYGDISDSPLSVGEVIHKTRLVVDEAGSEGAAATGVVMETTARMLPPPGFTFTADRPFWLLLRETTTGAPLFMGYVAAPSG